MHHTNRLRCCLLLAIGLFAVGAGAQKNPPLGAVVTDDKGIAALGILQDTPTVTGGSITDLTFTTFAHLDYVCDEVGLCPTLADVPGENAQQKASGNMVRVPGGPVRIPGGVMGEFYARVYKTNVVCTPPFLIDKLPITIGEYRTYLRQRRSPRLPLKWELDSPSELVQDIRRADLPVTGVYYDGAVTYAEALGKRLPTGVEWLKAFQGANMPWLTRRIAEAESLYEEMDEIYKRKVEHWQSEIDNVHLKKGTDKPTRVYVDTPLMRELNRQQHLEQLRYFRAYSWPLGLNAPVGIYP